MAAHCRIFRCGVVASDFMMYALNSIYCLILNKQAVYMQRMVVPCFEKIYFGVGAVC
jgi:hypothetical protein